MDKPVRILLILLLLITMAGIIFNVFSVNSRLKESLQLVRESQQQLKEAQEEIAASKVKLDSLNLGFQNFSSHIRDIQERVQILDLERRASDADFRLKKDSIKILLDSLYKSRGIHSEISIAEPQEYRNPK
ncbi:MAG TPA: hypothetical protein VIM75_22245 [Ohtaekwangia sp.]|uniref:hypothetical protein n=1 Tax=Ohtaekwangia sp. TaxID=2066019 RepID=UPI002F9501E8